MFNFKIRALTVALPFSPLEISHERSAFEKSLRVLNYVRKSSLELNVPIWSLRVTLKPIFLNEISRNPNILRDVDVLRDLSKFNYISIPIIIKLEDTTKSWSALKLVLEEFLKFDNLFISLNVTKYSSADVPLISSLYARTLQFLRNHNAYKAQARISLTLRGPLATPYFPSAASLFDEYSIMASLLYVKYLSNAIEEGSDLESAVLSACRYVEKVLSEVSESVGVKNAGIDISISPWIDESLLSLFKAYHNVDFPHAYTIRCINECLDRASRRINSVGFNEMMMPLAEDEWLKELVKKGILRLRDFIALSVLSVAGVDMIPLPLLDINGLSSIIYEILAFSLVKDKPFGVRLIATRLRSNDEINISPFGNIPIPLL